MTGHSLVSAGVTYALLLASQAAALFLLASPASKPPETPSTSLSNVHCRDYLLISARGTGQPQGPSVGFISAIRQTLAAVPNGQEVDVQYAADYSEIYQPGTDWTNRLLVQRQQQCPKEKHALLGYSQGAMVVASAVADHQPDDPIGSRISGVVVIGNPFHVPNRAGNVADPALDLTSNSFGILSNNNPTYLKYAKSGQVLDLCFFGDPVCDLGNGTRPNIHLTYGGSDGVQNLIAKFLISKLKA
ncbi:hypothetical protein OC845_000078 [Tilletia horrida]|nr:hypothetical protein OC845_000078 [Tilletia horrida]